MYIAGCLVFILLLKFKKKHFCKKKISTNSTRHAQVHHEGSDKAGVLKLSGDDISQGHKSRVVVEFSCFLSSVKLEPEMPH